MEKDILTAVTCPVCKESVEIQRDRWGGLSMGHHSRQFELEGGLFIRVACYVGGEELLTAEQLKQKEAV
jgi:hypothetical protein